MIHLVASSRRAAAGITCLALIAVFAPAAVLHAQSSPQTPIELFGYVVVRPSTAGTGSGSKGLVFNSATLNLTCPAAPITAVLSSTADGTGNLLVDNYIRIKTTIGGVTKGPIDVCTGKADNCFSQSYENTVRGGSLTGQDPDTFVSNDGVAPINISQYLVPGPQQLQIALEDVDGGPGSYLASSTLYLDTNCTSNGVTGPALVTGNPISGSTPTPNQLTQDFSFNPVTNQSIGFEYDLSAAQAAGDLSIQDGTIPEVADSPLDPAIFASQYTPGTSFSTSSCLIHSGESLATGAPACKLYTLECKIGTGANASGAQCPVSVQANEVVQDVFDGPSFSLNDIVTPNGTFHEGIGLIMASESWAGGACTFDTASDLGSLDCPQNLLTSFSSGGTQGLSERNRQKATAEAKLVNAGSGAADSKVAASLSIHPRPESSSSGSNTNTGTGRTSRPNSTFISIAQVPEDLTTVTVVGQQPGYWIHTSSANVTLSSQPPNLVGSLLPGAATFVPSPIQSITYGISPAASVPAVGGPVTGDVTLSNSAGCPTPPDLLSPAAATYTPGAQTLSNLADGYYLVHYFAQDCAGTEELQFSKDVNGNWSTNFYTYPINVDTVAPVVASGPTLSPAGSSQGTYTQGQSVTATFSCTDALSGIVRCGTQTYAPGATNNTGMLTAPVDTSSTGSKTFTVQAVDAAGNTSSASVKYQVIAGYDSQIQFSITPATVNYGQGASVVVQVQPPAGSNFVKRGVVAEATVPTGTIKVLDGTKLLQTLTLQGNGAAYAYIQGLAAGSHSLSAQYSGDAHDPSGKSAPVIFTVQPVPVTLVVACWNASFYYGGNYNCGAYASSNAGSAQGVITYVYDNAAPKKVALSQGVALFTITKPPVGQHTVVVSYAAQTNYAAAAPQTESFTVTPAPVYIELSPTDWYLTGGKVKFIASVQSFSAGAPADNGSVTFMDGSTLLAVVPVNAFGIGGLTVTVAKLPNGPNIITAAYAGGTNYGTGSNSITIQVNHP